MSIFFSSSVPRILRWYLSLTSIPISQSLILVGPWRRWRSAKFQNPDFLFHPRSLTLLQYQILVERFPHPHPHPRSIGSCKLRESDPSPCEFVHSLLPDLLSPTERCRRCTEDLLQHSKMPRRRASSVMSARSFIFLFPCFIFYMINFMSLLWSNYPQFFYLS